MAGRACRGATNLGSPAINTVNQPSRIARHSIGITDTTALLRRPHWIRPAARSICGPVSSDPAGGRIGYPQQWNFNIQRELPGNMVLDLGYIGTKSTGLQAKAS